MELKDKIIAFLGDSITEGHGVEDIENNRYDNVIKKKCGLKAVYNYGIGGTRIAHQSTASEKPRYDLCFCGRAYDLNSDADIIIVFGGTNDYGHGDALFGTEDDATPNTFCGAVEFLMTFLKETYSGKQIVFLTPARRNSDEAVSGNPIKAADAKPLKAYVDMIVKKGEKHNIPVLNLYNELGINPNIAEEREKYTTDGLHFNDDGQHIIAERVIDFLGKL